MFLSSRPDTHPARATIHRGAEQLCRPSRHGTRNEKAVTAFLASFTAVLAALAAIGVYDLQVGLEHWDHNRHLED